MFNMGTSASLALVTEFEFVAYNRSSCNPQKKNESDSSAKGKMKFALWEESRMFPIVLWWSGM